MDTDVGLKVIFRRHTGDFLGLLGDSGAAVLSTNVIEVQDLRRTVDCVIKLRKGGEVYYRHVEFQSEPDAQMAERCFRYNSQLLLQLGRPVLTTVLYLQPPGPFELAYRVALGGRVVNLWRFDVVRLWEMDVGEALASGAPGLLALVPLMSGSSLAAVGEAAQGILRALPGQRDQDALAILLLLAGRDYTMDQLAHLVGRDRMIQSSVWQAALAEGEAKGEAKGEAIGELKALRRACIDLIRKHHPALLPQTTPAVMACQDPNVLRDWLLACSDPDEAVLARLVGVS